MDARKKLTTVEEKKTARTGKDERGITPERHDGILHFFESGHDDRRKGGS